MHQFNCKVREGSIVPLGSNKETLFNKILKKYEEENKTFKVTIELVYKNINESQVSLYNAFIKKASDYFGNTFVEMQNILITFNPLDDGLDRRKPVTNWNTKELETFIFCASAFLAEQGFKFE